MNASIQDLINDPAGHSKILDSVMKLCATDLVFVIPVALLLLWFWPAGSRQALDQRIAALTGFAVVLGLALAAVASHVDHVTRPFVTDPNTHLLINHARDNGFPSDHATVAFAAATPLAFFYRRLGIVALALAALVGIARINVGVHWPLDVSAAAVIGLAAGAVLGSLAPLLEKPQALLARYLPRQLIVSP
jgi:undecaprenyl-diphosphatase